MKTSLLLGSTLILTAPLRAADPPQAPWTRHVIDGSSRGADGVRLMDVNGDNLPDIVTGWEEGGSVRLYLHPGHTRAKENWPRVEVGRVKDVEDAVLADLDGDGQPDVISAAEGNTRNLFIHWAPPDNEKRLDPSAWRTQPLPPAGGKAMWMFTLPMQIDGKSGIDFFAGAKGKDATIGWFESPATPRDLGAWKYHTLRDAGWIMSLIARDLDGDGDQDLLFSDRKQRPSGVYWLENPGPGEMQKRPWKEHAIGVQGEEVMFITAADLDGDRIEEIIAPTKPDRLIILKRHRSDPSRWSSHEIHTPKHAGRVKAAAAGDLDQDGTIDLVFSTEGANDGRHGLMWLSRTGPITNPDAWSFHPLSGVDGIKHDLIELLDLDDDGDLDVLTCEETRNLGVIWYENPQR